MALERNGGDILHSLYGRQLGVDKNGQIAGVSGVRQAYETSTAASTLTGYGVSILSGSTASHTLPAPVAAGLIKTIINASTVSTATMTVTRATSDFTIGGSTAGSTAGVAFTLLNTGSAMSFISVSTSQWLPTVGKISTLYYAVSTSS